MKKLIFIILFIATSSCQKEKNLEEDLGNRIVVKTVDKAGFKATLFKISTISDVTMYVSVKRDEVENIVFHGNFGSVIDLYFKGSDTLYLKCYKPSSNIIYKHITEVNKLKIIMDTLVTDEEYRMSIINR